jgi:hypothetical protein
MVSEISGMMNNITSGFSKTWTGLRNEIISSNGSSVYNIKGNDHLILCVPSNEYKSFECIFSSTLLITEFSKQIRKLQAKEIFDSFKGGMIDGSISRTIVIVGIYFEVLLTKIFKGNKSIYANIDFNDLPSEYDDICFYEDEKQWPLVDYLKFVEVKGKGIRTVIGIQSIISRTHSN